ncbi:MAG: ATP-binding cassette domain-containing protein, partial [Candidatus Dormiibacterota bacterium]
GTVGGAAAANGAEAHDIAGQHADFVSAPLGTGVDIVGAPTVHLRVASATGQAVLFVKLYDVSAQLGAALPGGLVAPVHLSGLGPSLATARAVTIQLPAIVRDVPAGDRLLLVVATSDEAFASPPQPGVYVVAAQGELAVPTVTGTPLPTAGWFWPWVLGALVVALLLGLGAAIAAGRWRRQRGDKRVQQEHAGTPLVVEGLRKEYANGFLAVDEITFRVEREQVVGLLGPNGAGKTTALRVLLGLTSPTRGSIFLFGHPLRPSAPVLSRLGALVEGPGFLPHLSGAANLRRFWQATGRPAADSHLVDALEIAGLGGAAERRVGTYSHGMKQRLAIAQAMLGLPDLLVLDEPTDGLDPPQIAEMRRVLQRYASAGRAVLVSSHLLAEVEQTCTHAIVVHRGRVVASGAVADLIGEGSTVLLDVSDPREAAAVLRRAGVRDVRSEGARTLVADLDGVPRGEVVHDLVNAGIAVERIVPRRRLEDAFLDLVGGDSKEGGER